MSERVREIDKHTNRNEKNKREYNLQNGRSDSEKNTKRRNKCKENGNELKSREWGEPWEREKRREKHKANN